MGLLKVVFNPMNLVVNLLLGVSFDWFNAFVLVVNESSFLPQILYLLWI